MKLEWLAGRYAVCRLDAGAAIPEWAGRPSALTSITRTERELSIITNQAYVDADVDVDDVIKAERGFVALRIVGTLEINLVGVLALLTGALRDAAVPVLAISTFDTDVLLVRKDQASLAYEALSKVATLDPPDF